MSTGRPAADGQWARRVRRPTPGEVLDVAEAVLALLAARLRFAVRPTAALVRELQARSEPAPEPSREGDPDPVVLRASRALARAAARVPWRADCLVQALAMDRLLRRRGHVPEFRLGVARAPSGAFAAHAWLVCDGVTVSGGQADGFSVLVGPEGAPAPAPRRQGTG